MHAWGVRGSEFDDDGGRAVELLLKVVSGVDSMKCNTVEEVKFINCNLKSIVYNV